MECQSVYYQNAIRNFVLYFLLIYTTKIEEFVCLISPKPLSLEHRPRIASTTIKLISKPIYCPFSKKIILKTIQPIGAYPKATEAQIVVAIPVSVTQLRFRVKLCRNTLCFAITESGWRRPELRVRVKQFHQSEFRSTTAVQRSLSCWPNHYNETRSRERKCFQSIRTVCDISRDDRARIATCRLLTVTDRLFKRRVMV